MSSRSRFASSYSVITAKAVARVNQPTDLGNAQQESGLADVQVMSQSDERSNDQRFAPMDFA
ncbi:hypothetical protein ACHAQJ_001951 [Trichoderma viride]